MPVSLKPAELDFYVQQHYITIKRLLACLHYCGYQMMTSKSNPYNRSLQHILLVVIRGNSLPVEKQHGDAI